MPSIEKSNVQLSSDADEGGELGAGEVIDVGDTSFVSILNQPFNDRLRLPIIGRSSGSVRFLKTRLVHPQKRLVGFWRSRDRSRDGSKWSQGDRKSLLTM